MLSFGISRQQASKDINTYLNDHAPKNLVYDRQLKGYKPSKTFQPLFIDASASAYLHLLDQNRDRAPHIEGLALAYAHTEVLQVPDRSIHPQILRPILRACREGLRLETEYVSLAHPEAEIRVMAPHTLVFTGMRWHVRAYCEKNREYRDFVLSRFRGEPDLMGASDNGRDADEAWNTPVTVLIEPDARLNAAQQAVIAADFGMVDGQLPIETRGALVAYVLQRYGIAPNTVHAHAAAQQLQVGNLQALKGWLIS
jgi:predicted DNA-binding transcriptional regulator YafY